MILLTDKTDEQSSCAVCSFARLGGHRMTADMLCVHYSQMCHAIVVMCLMFYLLVIFLLVNYSICTHP